MPILAGLQIESCSSPEFPCVKSGRGRIDHVRLFVDRLDGRLGRNPIARLVVAGQRSCTRADSISYQRSPRSN